MKESRFNEYYVADDGVKLAFNSYSCGLAVVDEVYENLLKNLNNLSKNNVPDNLKECFDAACEGSFIVDDDFDELLELSTKRNFQKYSMESLGLTIAPTMACNFHCIYCYETAKSGIMGGDVYRSIVDFVEYQAPHLKNLGVSWYGGEPLLAKDVIYKLSEEFLKICEKNRIEYNAFIISNGSLLDDETIEKLIKHHIGGIQITIDGPPEVHDNRRVNLHGDGTFELLINNINKLLKTNKIEVIIRVNVDKENINQVEKLISLLADRLICKDVKITFGQVTAYTEACKDIESTCYDNGEFAEALLKFYDILQKYGFTEYNQFPYPEMKFNYCCAELMNSFVVDHEGYLYKCWNEIGNVSRTIGNLKQGIYDISCCKNGFWLQRDPIKDVKCSKCSMLPACMGGCPHNDIVLKKSGVCDLIRYNIKNIMLKYYDMSKEED